MADASVLRTLNSGAALTHLLDAGRLTRARLRELTGVSKPTASEMMRRLTDSGLAIVSGRTAGGVGPTAEIYEPNADAGYVMALSVRGAAPANHPNLSTALCDVTGTVRDWTETRVELGKPADVVATAIRTGCARAKVDPRRVRQIHIGVAGSYDPGRDTLHHVALPGWSRPGLLATIQAHTAMPAGASLELENDVRLAAIAERHRGAAAGAECFCLVWLGTSVGLATDVGGTALRGARGGAGWIGHLPLCAGPLSVRAPRRREHPDGGTLQELIGGSAILALAAECGITAATPAEAISVAVALLAAVTGTTTGATTASATAKNGPARLVEHLANRIAFALRTVITVVDPPLIVLAGEVAQAGGSTLVSAVSAALAHAADASGLPDQPELTLSGVDGDAVLAGGLDAGLGALRAALIAEISRPTR